MTKQEKLEIKNMIKESLEEMPPAMNVADCQFYGVKFDDHAANMIGIIANGLTENAKALGALAAVFSANNIKVEAMIRLDGVGNIRGINK